jgi:hypothetical protein
MDKLVSFILPLLGGSIGWFATKFFAEPLLAFYDLRNKIFEELIVTGNILVPDEKHQWAAWEEEAERKRYQAAYETLRRYAAQLAAIKQTSHRLPMRYIDYKEYDLKRAAEGLIGVANCLARPASNERALARNEVEIGLQLPRTYKDNDIRQIGETMAARRS